MHRAQFVNVRRWFRLVSCVCCLYNCCKRSIFPCSLMTLCNPALSAGTSLSAWLLSTPLPLWSTIWVPKRSRMRSEPACRFMPLSHECTHCGERLHRRQFLEIGGNIWILAAHSCRSGGRSGSCTGLSALQRGSTPTQNPPAPSASPSLSAFPQRPCLRCHP